jgi:hypothetical protein
VPVKVLVVVAVVALALVVAELVRRRRPDAPTQPPARHEAPAQLDRADFSGEDAPWLVVVFTSATCSTCAAVMERARLLACDEVAVQEVEATADAALQRRYGVEAVPICVIADADGVVRGSFVGPVTSTHLWGAMAELRAPGSLPPGCGG